MKRVLALYFSQTGQLGCALARGFSVLDMRALFDDPDDYANPIEPSAQGGAKIAAAIAEWATA